MSWWDDANKLQQMLQQNFPPPETNSIQICTIVMKTSYLVYYTDYGVLSSIYAAGQLYSVKQR